MNKGCTILSKCTVLASHFKKGMDVSKKISIIKQSLEIFISTDACNAFG
jgi:hypothetical protein